MAAAAVLVGFLILYLIVLVRTAWLSDDSYITYRTIDNLVNGYGLRWNVSERVQSFTHPLWLMLLATIYFLTREIYLTAIVTSIAVSAATVALVGFVAWRRKTQPLILATVLAVLICSRAFVDYSTSGLENPLTHLLLAGFIVIFLDERLAGIHRLFWLGLLAGLGTLNRQDTVLFFAPALGWELYSRRNWRSGCEVLFGFIPFGLWEVFSIVYYGFPFPNTAYAKLSTGIGRSEYWQHGIRYFVDSLTYDPITLIGIAIGLAVVFGRGTRKHQTVAAGVVLYFLYILNIGGDFMSGRFFAAPLLATLIIAVDVLSQKRFGPLWYMLPVAVVLLGFVGDTASIASGSEFGADQQDRIRDSGIANERRFYYPATGLLIDALVSERPHCAEADAGRNAHSHADPLIVEGAVGFWGFFAGPDAYFVDYHALGDPLLSRLPMVKSDPQYTEFCVAMNGRPCTDSWRVGHYLRNVPSGYLESVLSNENRLEDDKLHKLYDVIRLITRDPIWSMQRWIAIVRMNLGRYGDLMGPTSPVDYQPIAYLDTYLRHPDTKSVSLLAGAAADYIHLENGQGAVECYRKVLALDPSRRDAWNNLGQILIMLGDLKGGEAALLQVIKLRPSHIQPYTSLGDLMRNSGREAEALALFRDLAQQGDVMAAEYLRGQYSGQ